MTATIDTWTIWSPESVAINIHKLQCKENPEHFHYNSELCFCLDSEEATEVNQEKWISLMTDVWADSAEACAIETLVMTIPLFGEVLSGTCFVLDENGDTSEEINLEEMFEKYQGTTETKEPESIVIGDDE